MSITQPERVCICSLRYPACKRHTVICVVPRSTIFHPHFLVNGTILEKKLPDIKYIFWFYLQLCMKHFSLLEDMSEIWFYIYTGCPRRNVPDFGRVFLMLKYTDITQNTYVQSWMVTEIMTREVWNFDSCYTLVDYQIHIKTGRNMWFM